MNEVAKELNIKQSAIVVSDVSCGSILVTFTITGASGIPSVSQELKKLVENGNISVTVNGKTFKANKLEVVRPTIPSTVVPTTEAKNEIAFILYITFGGLMAFIFIVGIIVLFVRCRRDRREGSFYLTNETNYELRRFQGIPRANSFYSRVNYYGEPVEKDATAADPDAEDEFQAAAGAYPYNPSPASACGKPIAVASGYSKEEKFNVGTMGMPEWKNLPKLLHEGIAVAEPKEGIPKSSGSVGSRELLLEGESGPADSRHAYDNPFRQQREREAAAGAYPYNPSPASARGKPIAAASGYSKEEKFNVGTMGMPEGKNLPKLSQEGIAVAEPKEGIPKSSGSVGSRELLLEGESGPADSRHAYDNPVLTFGDGPTGLDKEDS